MVMRSDRAPSKDGCWIVRQPQEDLLQALGLPREQKYEGDGGPGIAACVQLTRRTTEPVEAAERCFTTRVVFWLLAAIDGHAKNLSLHLFARGLSSPTPSSRPGHPSRGATCTRRS
ncbi:HipA domain-containing protein [Engelhardtia mirabilis]|uniref:HipA domain-containing protein n=1 Tax=Engelhardtia mirabilis TaxID=2528011 RepID=UPI003AF35EFD